MPPFPVPSLPNYFISSLAQTLNAGGSDTSIQLGTIYTLDGQVVQTADFATFGRGIVTIDPLNLNNVEFSSFTGLTPGTPPVGTLTGTLRGLSFKGNAQISANQKFHVVGSPVLIAFGTHNIIDIVGLINTSYNVLNNLIETIILTGSQDASQTQTGITRLSGSPDVVIGNPTISIANPAVITVANTLTVNDEVEFTTTGSLPAAITSGQKYYILAAGLTGTTFEISLLPGGTPISTLGDTQSGVHTVTRVTPYAQVFTGNPGEVLSPAYSQGVVLDESTTTYQIMTSTTSPSDLALYVIYGETTPSQNSTIVKYSLDILTGKYYRTVATVISGFAPHFSNAGIAVVGSFVYAGFIDQTSNVYVLFQFDTATLTQTNMTISGTAPNVSSGFNCMYSDGTNIYIASTGTTWYKYSISGSVATNVATITSLARIVGALCPDGTNVYLTTDSSICFATGTITKTSLTGTVINSISRPNLFSVHSNGTNGNQFGIGFAQIDSTKLYVIQAYGLSQGTGGSAFVGTTIMLEPVTKPA